MIILYYYSTAFINYVHESVGIICGRQRTNIPIKPDWGQTGASLVKMSNNQFSICANEPVIKYAKPEMFRWCRVRGPPLVSWGSWTHNHGPSVQLNWVIKVEWCKHCLLCKHGKSQEEMGNFPDLGFPGTSSCHRMSNGQRLISQTR